MEKYTKETLKTTEECIQAAQAIKENAKKVTNREEHSTWWDNKVDFERFINSLLETGGFSGTAYDDLLASKSIVYQAETTAGEWYEG